MLPPAAAALWTVWTILAPVVGAVSLFIVVQPAGRVLSNRPAIRRPCPACLPTPCSAPGCAGAATIAPSYLQCVHRDTIRDGLVQLGEGGTNMARVGWFLIVVGVAMAAASVAPFVYVALSSADPTVNPGKGF